MGLINEALRQDDPEKTLTALLLPSAGLSSVTLPVAKRYHDVLTSARQQKAQVGCSNPSHVAGWTTHHFRCLKPGSCL